MKSFTKVSFLILLIGMVLIPRTICGQGNSTYKMELVRSVQFNSEKQNHILAIFKVTPTIKDFKLILSMKVTYEIGQGAKMVNIQKQQEDNIRISIYGKSLPEKNQKLYSLIKDQVNLNTEEDIRFIAFDFYDITKTQIDTMSIIYGLWESNNEDVRNEKTFTFKVDKLN